MDNGSFGKNQNLYVGENKIVQNLQLLLLSVKKKSKRNGFHFLPWKRYNGNIMKRGIYIGKPEIQVGKSHGSRYSIREASENMGCDLRSDTIFLHILMFS